MTSISGDALQNQSIANVRELNSIAPNVNALAGTTDPAQVIFAIRGQSQANVLLTVDSAVGIYVDDVSNPHGYGLTAGLVDIQRVELLRGPQGTLYGRNTTYQHEVVVELAPGVTLPVECGLVESVLEHGDEPCTAEDIVEWTMEGVQACMPRIDILSDALHDARRRARNLIGSWARDGIQSRLKGPRERQFAASAARPTALQTRLTSRVAPATCLPGACWRSHRHANSTTKPLKNGACR